MKNIVVSIYVIVVLVVLQPYAHAQGASKKMNDELANCESDQRIVSTVTNLRKDENLIVISRLGNGESNRSVGLKRLAEVKRYLIESWERSPETIILAEGEKTEGKGRIDFYVIGILVDSLLAERNKIVPLYCGKQE